MRGWAASGDALTAPAVARNRDAILAVLRRVLPERGTVLEVASGSGEHAAYFAAELGAARPGLRWQPSDPEPAARRSVDAHATGHPAIAPALALDAAAPDWPAAAADAVLCINMIHIAPWAACLGLMAGAGRLLPPGAPLVLYGPFREEDRHTAPSNAAFDADLRARDPAWGVRDREAVTAAAAARGLAFAERIALPANNLCLVYRRAAG
ncbi:DUF938 domain-containing protein [Methylobacterium sp. NEAU 140]|uniref:DUF938 domain-containing protein n=1 Tax=Methylobacterium sp. NEAU 140 TaxID=3064945 RepID=UPI00273532C2|nr:DUF938 domain-containing protein [Methylobacterium sp. NEAU 140]MDP4025163.1 DUF938 domain-containing protein [Methylobacterium sp. NEAU 140]